MEYKNKDWGAIVRLQRNRKGWSLQMLGEAASVEFSSISRAERGLQGLNEESWIRIAKQLGLIFTPATLTLPPPEKNPGFVSKLQGLLHRGRKTHDT